MGNLKDTIIVLVNSALLIALSIDILYLYFAGAWVEPILPVLWIELAMFGLTPVFAIYLFIRFCRGLK